ncbi:monovalent cation/H(+) antiporter subunit G [Ravibacter arvi]|uniref:Monovalent cation/H(+) antiporter subunit G n=1 Tax=Ravibacter arvi TaxID=2051041 RepID=A0ABP8M114_9BACT
MTDVIIMILTSIGTLFILIAAIGVLRMPDFFLRLSVTIKAATLGLGFIMGGTALFFLEFSVTAKVTAIIFFLLITAPVSGHMIGRTAYFTGMKLWKGTVLDELKGKYDRKTHELTSDGDHAQEGNDPVDEL